MPSQVLIAKSNAEEPGTATGGHVCPWWVGYFLASPLRRLVENPDKILSPHVRPGMTVLDLGCAMGYFSLPLARMVGPSGRVVCVDVQERMIRALRRRARRKGLGDRIDARACSQDDLNLDDVRGRADVAVAFHVVHESSHPDRFFADCLSALRPGGKLILVEPMAHVSGAKRERIFELAGAAGFVKRGDLDLRRSRGAIFVKPEAGAASGE
jgi:2-polyprenyl-3-methyl-5-hydroxy-6-metoxy-1,4-benzoquinol methylase